MTFDPSTASPDTTFDPNSAQLDTGIPLKTVLETAVKTNPDQAARATQLSKETGIPDDVVARNLMDVEFQAAVNKADESLKGSPILAKQMRERVRLAVQAHDDVEPLKKVESSFVALAAAGASQAVLGVSESLFRTPDAAQRVTGYVAGLVEKTGLPAIVNPVRGLEDVLRILSQGQLPAGTKMFAGTSQVADAISSATKTLADDPATFGNSFSDLRKLAQNADTALKTAVQTGQVGQLGQVLTDKNYWTAFIGQAIPSLYTAMKSGGSVPFMAWMEGMEQASSAADFERRTGQKISDADFTQATMQTALVNSWLEKTGLDKVLGAQGKGVRGVVGAIFGEGFTESLQQVNSNLATMLSFDNAQSLLEGVVASFMGGAGAGGGAATARNAVTKVQETVNRRAQEQNDANTHAETLRSSIQTAATSKLRERNPEEFRTLVQAMADQTEGAPTEVFVDAEVLNQLAPEVLAQLPGVAEQMEAALAANGAVSISIGDVLAVAPGTPLEQTLVEHSRIGDSRAMSQFESKEAGAKAEEFLAQETQRVIQQANDQQAMQESHDRVKQSILDQLNTAGRFRKDVNDAYATWTTAFYTTMAGRYGITPEEMQARYSLKPVSKTGQGSVLNEEADFFNQDGRLMGINVRNDSGAGLAYADAIVDGTKTFETRNSDSLRPYVGQRVAIVRTGAGKAKAIGEVTLGEPILVDEARFREMQAQHLVPPGSTFDIAPGGQKYLYPMQDVVRYESERDVGAGIIARQVLNQSASIRAGDETLQAYGLEPGKQYNTRQIAQALEARQLEKYGSIARDDRSQEAISKIADWIMAEVKFEMENPSNSGVGWYSEKFQNALNTMGETFPELLTDQNARDVMTSLIAITSDGQKVMGNTNQAMDIYANFRETGQFTTDIGHQRQDSIDGNLEVLQNLFDELGAEGMRDFLMNEKSISDLKKIAKANGTELKSDYQAIIKMPMAVVALGPKLGAFYANLMGSHGYLTMDRWWSRTFNRYRGGLLTKPSDSSLRTFAALIGKPRMSDDRVLQAVLKPQAALEARGFKTQLAVMVGKSEPGKTAEKVAWMEEAKRLAGAKFDKLYKEHNIERAANTIYKMAFVNLEDAPFGAKDRTFMLDATNAAQKKLAAEGYNLSIADIQAILWYYEKKLYGELGARSSGKISYEEAARIVVDARNNGIDISELESPDEDEDSDPAEGGVPLGEEIYNAGNESDGVLNQSPTFYSALSRAVEGAKQSKAPAKDWLAIITKLPGVKAEEVEWTGLREYLELRGKDQVTKQEISDYLAANGVQVDEVMKGEADPVAARQQAADDMRETMEAGGSFDIDAQSALDQWLTSAPDSQMARQAGVLLEEKLSEAGDNRSPSEYIEAGQEQTDSTKYAGYQLPGGENYRELLLTLPSGSTNTDARDFLRSLGEDPEAYYGFTNPADYDAVALSKGWKPSGKPSTDYRSNHWEEKNILAHIRFNDRIDADGKKVLFIEELQSDWAQDGRKRGFGDKLMDGYSLVEQEPGFYHLRDKESSLPLAYGSLEKVEKKAKLLGVLKIGVPTAPFVGETKAWLSLGIKRMIRYAAENGYDKVAFVNGEQSADRYNLSKQVDRIVWLPGTNGLGGELKAYDARRQEVVSKSNVSDADLSDLVGKEIAERILSRTPDASGFVDLENQDLKVGGEGMKSFYDKIVPQTANDVLKKLGGGKIETIAFKSQRERLLKQRNESEVGSREYEQASMALYEIAQEGAAPEIAEQAGFTITDAMRELVMGGQALFQGARGTFNPKTLELALNENADLSTFLHETGHFFLEVMADLASQPDAPADIQSDMAELAKWFGIADLATWNAMSLDQKRPYHERFAESFEQYLLEGKAPSVELQPLFRKFRAWMLNVYKSLKAFIAAHPEGDVQLSDEVRQVFDRMLASEAQIAEAEQVAGLLPEENATAEAVEKLTARSLRDLKWTVNARSKAIKALQKQAAELRKGVEAEIRAEVGAQPVYAARQFLKTDTKLDTATLSEMYMGEGDKYALLDWKTLSDQKLAGTDGVHPDIIADMFGFESGDALVRSLLTAEPMASVVEGMTDQRMLEEHGDLIDQRAIASAANEAVHNEARARSLATELRSQAEMLNPRTDTGEVNAKGSKITVNAIVEAAKQFAANVIARTPLRDLKSKVVQHTAAERRAGKRWQEHTAKGETQEAVKAKQDQVLNNAAAKAAVEAQEEMRKILTFFKRVIKDGNEKTVEKGRDPDVVNAARAILGAYGIAPKGAKNAAEYMDLVAKNDPAMFAALQSSVQGALNMAQPLDALTMEELRGLHEEIQAMWHLAKRSRQMEVDGDMMEIDDAAEQLQERMQEIGVPDAMPGETGAITKREAAGRALQFAGSLLRRAEQWADGMGSAFTKLVFQPIKDAANAYRADRVKYRKAYQALVDKVAPYLRKGTIAAPELNYTFGKGHNGIGHAELLHAILHTGNESNKRKLLLGRKWATENEDGTLDTTDWDNFIQRMWSTGVLTGDHYTFAQGVWDLLEQTKPLAQKTHRDVFGRYFAEVTADEFETPFGTYRGGYVPAQADPRIVQDAALRDLASTENENMAFSFPGTNKGFTKGRVEYNRPLLLDLRTIGQHIDKVLLFSHMEPAVRDVNKLLSRKGVSYSLGRIDPTIYAGMLTPWLNRSARQIVETPIVGDGGISRVLSAARGRAGMALMFGNISNAIQQLTGFSTAFSKLKADGLESHMMKATAQFITSPRKSAQAVSDASPFMATRMENEISAINDAMDAILLDPNLYQKAQAWTQKHAYFLQSALANTMEPIIWSAGYNAALEKNMSEKEAVRYADGLIRQTQGSTLPEDVSRIETGPAYARVFTQFIGYFNMMANTNATSLKQVSQEMGVKKGAGKMLGIVALGMLVPLWTAEAIAIAMRGGPDDKDDDGYLDDWLAAVFGMGTIKGTLAMIPFVGTLGNAAINRFNNNPADDKMSLSPAVSMLEAAVGVPKDVYMAITDPDKLNKRNAVRDVASAISLLTGLPATAIARPLGYIAALESGKVNPTSPLDAARGLVTGTPSPGSK